MRDARCFWAALSLVWVISVAGCGEAAMPQGSYGTIIGTVSEAASGRPVQGASVTVDGVLVVTTGVDGKYRVPTVPVDSATTWTTVSVQANGYAPQSNKVKVQQSQEARLDFQLTGR